MAKRKRNASRRAGRVDTGSSWISYSDMMAAMMLVFVLVLCYSLYQYFIMLETKTQELDDKESQITLQQAQLDDQSLELVSQRAALTEKETELETAQALLTNQQAQLETQQDDLEKAQTALASQEQDLIDAQAALADQQNRLDAANSLLQSQQSQIDDLVGVRTRIIQELSTALQSASLRATVDPNNGNIILDSTVFFDTASSTIKASGKALLDEFVPVYLSVLLQPEYSDYLGSIIIEGHTDTQGEYLMNLELSQQRALAVVKYCLQMPGLTDAQQETLRSILTSTGRSYSDPIYNEDGTINMDESRRVEFKFSLKDAEMIDQMNKILTQQ